MMTTPASTSHGNTFKTVMEELSVTSSEELDLLIRHLGPDSTRQQPPYGNAMRRIQQKHSSALVWGTLWRPRADWELSKEPDLILSQDYTQRSKATIQPHRAS